MKRMQSRFIFWLAAMVLMTACSQNDERNSGSTTEAAQIAHTEKTAEPIPSENVTPKALPVINRSNYHTIEIKQMKFNPEKLIVKKGDTVVWVNNGITLHDVTQQPANTWSSKAMAVGTSWTMIAKESAEYYCSIHVVMKGSLVVQY